MSRDIFCYLRDKEKEAKLPKKLTAASSSDDTRAARQVHLKRAPLRLLALYRFKQGLEVAGAEAARAHALDDLEE